MFIAVHVGLLSYLVKRSEFYMSTHDIEKWFPNCRPQRCFSWVAEVEKWFALKLLKTQ